MSGVNLLLDPTKWAQLSNTGYQSATVQGPSPPAEWISADSDYEITDASSESITSSTNTSQPVTGYILAYQGTPTDGDFIAFTMTNNSTALDGYVIAQVYNTWSLDGYNYVILPDNPTFTIQIPTGGVPKTCNCGPFSATDKPLIVVFSYSPS